MFRLNMESGWKQENDKILWLTYRKCLETGETTKSLEKSLFQGILSFYCFWTLLIWKVSRNKRNNKIP